MTATSYYVSPNDVRLLADIDIDDIGDRELNNIIEYATAELNAEIGVEYNNEKVERISDEKENDIDGSNTTFYVKHPYIGDRDNDGDVDTSDIYVYTIDSDGTRTEMTVSSVDWELGQFVLSSAPSTSDELYVTYISTKIDCSTPHILIKKACIELSASLAFTKVEANNFKRIGGLAGLSLVAPETYNIYHKLYMQTLDKIRRTIVIEKKTDNLESGGRIGYDSFMQA